jgi:hypothetical protein
VTSSLRPSPPKRGSRCHAATRMVCKPCGRREAVTGGLGPPLGPLGRLPSSPCVSASRRATGWASATSQDTHAAAPPNRSSRTLGRHWVPTADRPDAFKDRCSTNLAVAHLRNDDHPAQPHGIVTTLKRWACGWEPYRLVWFQRRPALLRARHVQTMFNE